MSAPEEGVGGNVLVKGIEEESKCKIMIFEGCPVVFGVSRERKLSRLRLYYFHSDKNLRVRTEEKLEKGGVARRRNSRAIHSLPCPWRGFARVSLAHSRDFPLASDRHGTDIFADGLQPRL